MAVTPSPSILWQFGDNRPHRTKDNWRRLMDRCGLVVVAKKTAYHERPVREDALPAAAPAWQPLRAGTSGGTQDGTCRRAAKQSE
jgi:hypothetical protein